MHTIAMNLGADYPDHLPVLGYELLSEPLLTRMRLPSSI